MWASRVTAIELKPTQGVVRANQSLLAFGQISLDDFATKESAQLLAKLSVVSASNVPIRPGQVVRHVVEESEHVVADLPLVDDQGGVLVDGEDQIFPALCALSGPFVTTSNGPRFA